MTFSPARHLVPLLRPPQANLDAAQAARHQAHYGLVRDFLDYYISIHPGDALPTRTVFDPTAIPRLLPNLVLAEVVHQPDIARPRFRIKVAGDEVVQAMRMPLNGRFLDEIANTNEPTARFPIETRHSVVENGCLIYRRGQPRMRFSLDYAEVEYVHCPLAEDGVTVDHIVSIIYYKALETVTG
ncbi:hypothetical protein FNB15_18740 [Ferrovibrio terrae]|uniref:PAS domain-containing protein n=1 Tax=Ferrovibrio terrae TaxID=2594003 RepID=A0A516H5Z2_9PROT|nr:hypothetical protein [Ferrovibrio terrae]QDO99186.1 hypothetical protein FNB15_18740 [Ferrovibrio terrae]